MKGREIKVLEKAGGKGKGVRQGEEIRYGNGERNGYGRRDDE